jgi:predicted nucleic acid-binding protein
LSEVISDTSPLQYLHQLGLLHLLPTLVGRIVVPASVERELLTGFTGTLGLLLDAKKAGLVTSIRPLLDRLQVLRFRLSPQARSTILRLAGED